MKTFKTLAFALIAAISFSSCQKYPDGPAISFITKLERVSNDWEVKEARRGGENVTDDYDEYSLYINKDYSARLEATYSFNDATFIYQTDGTWEFNNDKEELYFDFEDDDADGFYYILKLERDELWIEDKDDGTELRFEPIQ